MLILDGTSFPKQGRRSVAVARQYCGTLGKVANCQVAVTAALWTGVRASMLGAALYLPEEWLTPEARQRARIPDTVRFQEKWRLALTLLRQIRAAGFDVTAVLGDAEFGDNATLRRTLHRLKLPYALGISSTLTVFRGTPHVAIPPKKPGRSRPPSRLQLADDSRPEAVRTIAATLPARQWRRITWRNGTNRPWAAHFAALRVTPAHDWRTRRLAPEVWLLFERDLGSTPPGEGLPRRAAGDGLVAIARPVGASPLGHRTAVPGAERRARTRSLRGPLVCRLASSCRTDRHGLQLAAGRTPAGRGTRTHAASGSRGHHGDPHRKLLRDQTALLTNLRNSRKSIC